MKKISKVMNILVFISELLIAISFVGASVMVLTSNGRYRFHNTADVVVYGILTIGVIMKITDCARRIINKIRNKRISVYNVEKMSW